MRAPIASIVLPFWARDMPNAVWASFTVLVIVYAGMVTGAIAALRSMARRWRSDVTLDLPTPYSPPPAKVAE